MAKKKKNKVTEENHEPIEVSEETTPSSEEQAQLTQPEEQVEMAPVDLEPEDQEMDSDSDQDLECSFSLEERKRVIEAVLFVSDKSVGMSTIKAAFGDEEGVIVTNKHLKEALESLELEYDETNRGFRLNVVDGGYQIRTAEDLKPFLQNTIKARSFRLTGPSLETLAMIAYKQPCTKSELDEIRGVESSHLVRALMDRGLVAFAGKSELPGKPMLYKTTAKFLEIFGLRNLKELPSLSEIEALLPNGIGEEEEEKETLSDLTGKLSEQFEGEYSVHEEELGKISDQLSSISTETDYFEQEKMRLKAKKEADRAESIKEALMVGEEVSTRDKNWLEKYEAAQLAENTEAENSEENSEETAAVSLEANSPEESLQQVEETEADEEMMELEASEEIIASESSIDSADSQMEKDISEEMEPLELEASTEQNVEEEAKEESEEDFLEEPVVSQPSL